jgi:hypothetical protein
MVGKATRQPCAWRRDYRQGCFPTFAQPALGLHHRRLNRLIDNLMDAFDHCDGAGLRTYDLYVARLIDLLDLLVGVTRSLPHRMS